MTRKKPANGLPTTVKGTWIRDRAWWAAQVYLARKYRHEHPDGSKDRAGRWYPSREERQECCGDIRGPTRHFPWSLSTHCRTSGHVALLLGADPAKVAKHGRAISRAGDADTAWLAARLVESPGSITRRRDEHGIPFDEE